jgi:hypothetical protein
MWNLVGIGVGNPILLRPDSPTANNRANGTDQDAIHIEEQALRLYPYDFAQTSAPFNTKVLAASRTLFTESVEQLSQ